VAVKLNYNQDWHNIFIYKDGFLIWKIYPCPAVSIGDVVTYKNSNGYRQVKFKGKCYYVARIIWVMHFGSLDENLEIDHIDRNRSNDVIENLRICVKQENLMNKGEYSNNTSGMKGVYWHANNKKWRAEAYAGNGVQIRLGEFVNIEDAKAAMTKYRKNEVNNG